ncbi:MAG: putative nucleotide-diphospho-sugar transferase [Polyangia bacterium]
MRTVEVEGFTFPVMKVYACYSPSHLPLLEQHFKPSLPPDLEPVYRELPQEGSGTYGTREFNLATKRKFEFVLDAIKEATEPFLFSDVDVRFYGVQAGDLLRHLQGRDVVFQAQGGPPALDWGVLSIAPVCAGFFVVAPSQAATKFFEKVLKKVGDSCRDQEAVNLVLTLEEASVKWGTLPASYYTVARREDGWLPVLRENWDPVTPIWMPEIVLAHHANWTVGIENKLRLLDEVKRLQEERADHRGNKLLIAEQLRNWTRKQLFDESLGIVKGRCVKLVLRRLDFNHRPGAVVQEFPFPTLDPICTDDLLDEVAEAAIRDATALDVGLRLYELRSHREHDERVGHKIFRVPSEAPDKIVPTPAGEKS